MSKSTEATLLLKIKSAGEGVLSKTKAALGDLRTWAAAAFAALTSGAAVMAFKEAEETTNKLNQSLIQQGIYTKELSAEYQKMAADLQAVTTFEDDSIKAAMAQMQAYLGQTKISKELMKATLDLAAAKKMDLASAAEMVGKSIGTSTNALARQGIEIDKGTPKAERLALVIDGLSSKFGGQAEAAAQGLGALEQAKNAFGDLLEVVGEKFAPFIVRGAQAVTQLANTLASNQQIIVAFEMALQFVAKVLAGMRFQVMLAVDAIGTLITALYGAITAIASGEFRQALDSFVTAFDEAPKKMRARWDQFQQEISDIDGIYAKQRAAKQEEEIRNKKKSEERKAEIEKKAEVDSETFFKARSEKELADEITKNRLLKDQRIAHLNRIIEAERGSTVGLEAELEKRRILDDEFSKNEIGNAGKTAGVIRALGIERVGSFTKMLSDMEGMQNSKNAIMVGVGKAAAIANIAINTANAAMGAHAALDSIPVVGPGLGIAAAGSIVAMGAEKSANVAGIQLAEGGIVRATPGGVHAIIGEGGRDEAVIPLDRGAPMLGTTINLIVQGGVLGDAQQRREFCKVIDEEFFRMRQGNESLAFDEAVT